MIVPMIIPGIYRHYKGGLYMVLGVARHHEAHGKEYVVYHPLYLHGVEKSLRLNIRPLYGSANDPDGWLEPVLAGSVLQQRFALVMPLELASVR